MKIFLLLSICLSSAKLIASNDIQAVEYYFQDYESEKEISKGVFRKLGQIQVKYHLKL